MTLTPKRRPIRTAMSSLAGNRRSPPLRRQRQRWLYARIVALLSPSADLAALTAADPADSREQVAHRECGEHGYASVAAATTPKPKVATEASMPRVLAFGIVG